MGNIDKRGCLKACPFAYKITKSNKTLIYYENRPIMTLGEKATLKLKHKINNKTEEEIQLILAKVTGHFKHGNER